MQEHSPICKKDDGVLESTVKLRHMGPDQEVPLDKDNDNQKEVAGRWYHSGAGRTAAMLRELGYEVVSEDLGLLPRDALVHFRKP